MFLRLLFFLFPFKEALRGRKMGASCVCECRVSSKLRGGVEPAPGCGFGGMRTSVGMHHSRGVVTDAGRGESQVTGVARERAVVAPACQTSAREMHVTFFCCVFVVSTRMAARDVYWGCFLETEANCCLRYFQDNPLQDNFVCPV